MYRVVTMSAIGLIATMAMAQPGARKPVKQPSRSGLCRNAPALAPLPPERTRAQSQQRPRGGYPEPVLTAMDGPPPPPAPMPPPPPPAPEPVTPPPASSSADIVTTGSRVVGKAAPTALADTASPMVESRDGAMPPGRGGYAPQPGILTAGEHDDLLNPELYANYVRRSDLGQRWQTLPLVDTGRALTIAVTDRSGQPLPLADVTLTCADGNTLTLRTLADGTAVFFPTLDRLGESVRLSVSAGGRAIASPRTVAIPAAPGPQRVSVTAGTMATAAGRFDLMLVIDTTGSMGDEISYLKSELRSILTAIRAAHPQLDMRIGLVFYRDIGDDYVTRTIPFTANLDATQATLGQQYAGGGGDYPEAVDEAMNRAVNDFKWRPDAIKSMLWVADAPPHDELVGKAWAAAEVARARRIQIVPVAASGVAKEAEFMMRAMAAATQSRYLFLTDDSGVGLPHNKPAIDCYLVTKLDALVRRVLDSQISGRRIEPGSDEVIRTVGKYDAGKCILPSGNWQQED